MLDVRRLDTPEVHPLRLTKDRWFGVCLAGSLLFGLVVTPLLADTYITFRGARYYSARRNSFVEVSATGRVAFYRNRRGERPLWTHRLANIPASVLVTDDGHATVFVDAYYGNHRAPDATVLSWT